MFQRGTQVPYAGIHTFARARQKTIDELRTGDVAVLGVPHDGTSSSRQGVRLGPRGIREASVDFIYGVQSAGTVVDVLTGHTLTWSDSSSLADLGDLAVYPTDVARTENTLRGVLAAIVGQGAFPVILGGDHYITYTSPIHYSRASPRRLGGKERRRASYSLAAHWTWVTNILSGAGTGMGPPCAVWWKAKRWTLIISSGWGCTGFCLTWSGRWPSVSAPL